MMKFVQAIQDLLNSWYSRDRIRLSPTRGSLVRLQIGDRILIREMLFIVVNRDTILRENTSLIVYKLRETDSLSPEEGTIFVELLGLELEFISAKREFGGEMIELFEDDLIVL